MKKFAEEFDEEDDFDDRIGEMFEDDDEDFEE